jgi:hypothetical protein
VESLCFLERKEQQAAVGQMPPDCVRRYQFSWMEAGSTVLSFFLGFSGSASDSSTDLSVGGFFYHLTPINKDDDAHLPWHLRQATYH